MNKPNKIILHCSSTDVKHHDKIEVIKEWHLLRGFTDIGYHYFIDKKGVIHKGRDITLHGEHCKGYNKNSIGICVSGEYDFKFAQFVSLKALLYDLSMEFNIKPVRVFYHNQFSENKTCPNFRLDEIPKLI